MCHGDVSSQGCLIPDIQRLYDLIRILISIFRNSFELSFKVVYDNFTCLLAALVCFNRYEALHIIRYFSKVALNVLILPQELNVLGQVRSRIGCLANLLCQSVPSASFARAISCRFQSSSFKGMFSFVLFKSFPEEAILSNHAQKPVHDISSWKDNSSNGLLIEK